MRFSIVWAWLAGCCIARLLKDKWHEVHIYEKRNVIGGNCYDERIDGICVHKYWPHIFHTNDKEVRDFLNRFTEFEPYQHKVKAYVDWEYVWLPYQGDWTKDEIYEKIVKNYTQKMRGFENKSAMDRFSYEQRDRYFWDKYQWIPKQWYTAMLTKMIEWIPVTLNCDEHTLEWQIIWTGRIDDYFNRKFWELEYHKTKFEVEKHTWTYQEVSQVNYPNDYDFIRVTEHKHWYRDTKNLPHTIITKEYPREWEVECYPVATKENIEIYNKYKNETIDVIFLWRLATYEYLDMWKIVRNALDLSKKWEQN